MWLINTNMLPGRKRCMVSTCGLFVCVLLSTRLWRCLQTCVFQRGSRGFVLFQFCYIDLKFSLNNGCCNSDYKCWGHYSGRVTYYTSLVTLKSNSVSPTLPSHSCPSLHLKKSHVYTRYSKSASLYHFLPPTHARKSADCSRESVQEIKNMFLSVRPAGRELKNDIIVTVM